MTEPSPPLFATAVVVAPTFGRERGGVGASLARLTRGNAFAAERVVVLTPDAEAVPRGRFERLADAQAEKRTVERYAFGWKTGDGAFLAELVAHFLALSSGPHLAVAFYVGELAFPTLAAGRLAGARTMACGRGNDVDQGLFGRDAFELERALRHADVITTVTSEMAAKLSLAAPPVPPQVVWNSVDGARFTPRPRPARGARPTVIGMFGELKAKKGLAVLLEAMDFGTQALRIVGRLRESEAKLLHGFLQLRPDCEAKIRVDAYTDDAEALLAAYRDVDIVCLPSLADGMPNVLLEAMAAGCVTVSTRVGGAPEVVAEGVSGFLCAPRDCEALATAIGRAEAALSADGGRAVGEAARARILSAFSEEQERAGFRRVLRGSTFPAT